jgi:pimeloyl-ACP methyl ester carboxylesterase
VGVSAGGPYAVAAALAAGRRVERLVLAGAVAERGMIRLAGGAVRIFERFRRHRGLFRVVLPRLINQARNHGFDARFVRHVLSQELDRFAPEVDRTLVAQSLLISLREGLRPGLQGLMQDVELLTAEWDVAPSAISVPTLVLHGEADTIVPPMHARWYGEQIRGAHVEIHRGHGHVSLVINRARQVIEFLQA